MLLFLYTIIREEKLKKAEGKKKNRKKVGKIQK